VTCRARSYLHLWGGGQPWYIQEKQAYRPSCARLSPRFHAHSALPASYCSFLNNQQCRCALHSYKTRAHGATGKGYNGAQLAGILGERNALWERLCALGGCVPAFLQRWRLHVLGMHPLEVPDYQALRELLAHSVHEAATWEPERALQGFRRAQMPAPPPWPFDDSQASSSGPPQPSQDGSWGSHTWPIKHPGEQTPAPAAACRAAAAPAPDMARPARNKRMRPASPACDEAGAQSTVAKRLQLGAACTALASEE
jgi:hypothetical protein